MLALLSHDDADAAAYALAYFACRMRCFAIFAMADAAADAAFRLLISPLRHAACRHPRRRYFSPRYLMFSMLSIIATGDAAFRYAAYAAMRHILLAR